MELTRKDKKAILENGIRNLTMQEYLLEIDVRLLQSRALDGDKESAAAYENLAKRLDHMRAQIANYEHVAKEL